MKSISSKLTDLAGNENFKPRRVFFALLAAVLALAIFAGCKSGKKDGVTEVIIGTGSDYHPYCYLDEKNELTGFEKAVLDEIDRRLPEYKFTYRIFNFANILLSLETGAIDIAAHQ
ncbi:MAG: transporter substrate-binding domain-containing protein, partial [Treponema sp.]|nr:transporter substrate-binding domain-containing protein [Treponema sp.]